MTKKNLISKKKDAGTFIRLSTDFKIKAKVYAAQNQMSLTDLFIRAVEKEMKS